MGRQMPKEMQDMLFDIDDPDRIREIQSRWNELVAVNDNYERVYPQQFAALVESNLKFKEQKSIPTPAEQMKMYEHMVTAEINDALEKGQLEKEHLYELDDGKADMQDKQQPPGERLRDFQLTFNDMEEKDNPLPPGKDDKVNDKDKSGELNVTWLQEHKEARERENKEFDTRDLPKQQPYELGLTFGSLEELDRSDREIEPGEPGMGEIGDR